METNKLSSPYTPQSGSEWKQMEQVIVYYHKLVVDKNKTGYAKYTDSDGDNGLVVYASESEAAERLAKLPQGFVVVRAPMNDVLKLCMKMLIPYIHIFRENDIKTVRLDTLLNGPVVIIR